uniref:Uncharacterized protein n=1 Tax=Syphacia muris TaxID=451379 RepID=A0A0N5AUF0_9BILA
MDMKDKPSQCKFLTTKPLKELRVNPSNLLNKKVNPATANQVGAAATTNSAGVSDTESSSPQRICCMVQAAPANTASEASINQQPSAPAQNTASESTVTTTQTEPSHCSFQPLPTNCQLQPKPVSVALQASPVRCEVQSPTIDCEVRSKMVIMTSLNGQPSCSCTSAGSPSCTILSSARPTCTVIESSGAPKVTFSSNTQPEYYNVPTSNSNINFGIPTGQNCSPRYLLCCSKDATSKISNNNSEYSYNNVNTASSIPNADLCCCCKSS